MAEENKDLAELVAIISALKSTIDSKLRKTIREIIELAYDYPFHNKQFTFDKDEELADSVNKLLISLSDSIANDIDDYCDRAIVLAESEEDKDKILAFIHRQINGEDMTERLDKHMTRLRNALEAFIAIGFANFMTAGDLFNSFMRNIRNPFGWSPMKEAYTDPLYEAIGIREKGFVFGSHIDRDIEKAIGLVGTGAIIGSFDYGKQLYYQRDGATGWTTVRGSTYDCAVCDDMVGVRHSMDEIFYGWHPRCLCILVPLYD